MSKNIYKNAMDSIKISDEALEKAVLNARNLHIKINKSKTKSKKIYAIRTTGIIAASLAVVLLLGAVFFPINPPVVENGVKSTNHSFILKASAAEIGKDIFVKVGNIDLSASGARWQREGNLITNISATGFFNLDIQCEGKNIETVTYTPQRKNFVDDTGHAGEYLLVDEMYSGLIEYKNFTADYYETVQRLIPASSCTFDYDNQPQSNKVVNGVDGDFPLLVRFVYNDTENKYEADVEKYLNTDERYAHLSEDSRINIPFEEILCESNELGCVDITATFTDGTTITKTLQFKCELDEDKTYLTAKIK